jgi:Protein of unknown function (DUF742)
MTTNPWLRPYVLTGGRTVTRQHLLVHTLVGVENYDPAFAARLLPEAQALYERAYASTESVAELSAHCGISLGVTRVLLGDLTASNRVLVYPETYDSPYDPRLLKEVINGLRALA